jgi:hypothetical protein
MRSSAGWPLTAIPALTSTRAVRMTPLARSSTSWSKTINQGASPGRGMQRAGDHLKGSLMLSLENTASRMSHLARQEIYFDRQFTSTGRCGASRRSARRTCSASPRLVQKRIAGGDRSRQRQRSSSRGNDSIRIRVLFPHRLQRARRNERASVTGPGFLLGLFFPVLRVSRDGEP